MNLIKSLLAVILSPVLIFLVNIAPRFFGTSLYFVLIMTIIPVLVSIFFAFKVMKEDKWLIAGSLVIIIDLALIYLILALTFTNWG